MAALTPGSKAPDFELPDRDGAPHSLSDALRKGPVLLTFFKISCPTCQYGVPFISRLAAPLEGKPATVWGISQDSPENTAGFNRVGSPESLELTPAPKETALTAAKFEAQLNRHH